MMVTKLNYQYRTERTRTGRRGNRMSSVAPCYGCDATVPIHPDKAGAAYTRTWVIRMKL